MRDDAPHPLVHGEQIGDQLRQLRDPPLDAATGATISAVEALEAGVLVAERRAEPGAEVCLAAGGTAGGDEPANLGQRPAELIGGEAEQLGTVAERRLLAEAGGGGGEVGGGAGGTHGVVDGASDGALEDGDGAGEAAGGGAADAQQAGFVRGGV